MEKFCRMAIFIMKITVLQNLSLYIYPMEGKSWCVLLLHILDSVMYV